MTSDSILNLSTDRIGDFVRVYNSGRSRWPNFAPITEQDINSMLRDKLLSPELVFLAMGGPRPIATIRWGWNGADGWAFLTDLSCVPGLWSSTETLIEHILVLARNAGFAELRTWVPSCYSKLAEILIEFAFEPRRVHLQMRASLDSDFGSRIIESKRAVKWKPELREHIQSPGLESFRPLEIHEARDHSELHWEPRCYVKGNDRSPALIGYRARNAPTKGWISLREDVSKKAASCISREMVTGILAFLYSDGVRETACEIDAAKETQTPFSDAGFEVLLTLYEMELTMFY